MVGWPVDQHRAGRQEPAGCGLTISPHPSRPSIKGTMERADTGHAKADQVRRARAVTTMFDELRTMADRQAELHAERARLERTWTG
jgi:hypothetical protein